MYQNQALSESTFKDTVIVESAAETAVDEAASDTSSMYIKGSTDIMSVDVLPPSIVPSTINTDADGKKASSKTRTHSFGANLSHAISKRISREIKKKIEIPDGQCPSKKDTYGLFRDTDDN